MTQTNPDSLKLYAFFREFLTPERKEKFHIYKILKEGEARTRSGEGRVFVPSINIYVIKRITKEETAQLTEEFYAEYERCFQNNAEPFAYVKCNAKFLNAYGGKFYQMYSVNRTTAANGFGFSDYEIYSIPEEAFNRLLVEKYPYYKEVEGRALVGVFKSENKETAPIYRELLNEGLTDEAMEMILNR